MKILWPGFDSWPKAVISIAFWASEKIPKVLILLLLLFLLILSSEYMHQAVSIVQTLPESFSRAVLCYDTTKKGFPGHSVKMKWIA